MPLVKQRSYVSFITEETTMEFLLPHLLADERLWFLRMQLARGSGKHECDAKNWHGWR